jgi:hypothetical protein
MCWSYLNTTSQDDRIIGYASFMDIMVLELPVGKVGKVSWKRTLNLPSGQLFDLS